MATKHRTFWQAVALVVMMLAVVPSVTALDEACEAVLLHSDRSIPETQPGLKNATIQLYASMNVNVSQIELYFNQQGAQPQSLNFFDESAETNQNANATSGGVVGSSPSSPPYWFITFTLSPKAQLKAGSFYQLEFYNFLGLDWSGEPLQYSSMTMSNGTLSNLASTGLVFTSNVVLNGQLLQNDSLIVPSLALCGIAVTPSPSASPSPSRSNSPSPSRTPSPSPSPTASPSPSSSISPSALPKLVAATNVSADFANATVTFNMSASFSSSSSSNNNTSSTTSKTSVRSDLVGVQVGNVSVPAASLANLTVTRVNDSALGTSGVTYAAQLEDSHLEQTFALFTRDTATSFAGVNFTVGANSVKWTLNLTSSSSGDEETTTSQHASEWSVVRYRLSSAGLVPTGANASSSSSPATLATPATPIVRANTPTANQTTYFLPLFATTTATSVGTAKGQEVMAKVVLFDVALVDGTNVMSIRHSIVPVPKANATSINNDVVNEYEVVLELPPFNDSLLYDPSVGLGLLLGADTDGSGGGSSSDNKAVVIGVAVAVPVAIAFVVVVAAVVALVWWKQRRQLGKRWNRGSVNFSHDAHL